VHEFQTNEKKKIFLGNIKAAGVGLTLTASSRVAFLELPWTPSDLVQAEDRAHRIGQKNSVNIYYLLAEKTIDLLIARLLDKKRKIVDVITEGRKTENSALLLTILKSVTTS
jgi:SWI/SNF-related matrix-associated actin-dependent regulator 1 of chromatin subfamily A